MEACSIARIINLGDLAMRPKKLCRLLIKLLSDLLLKESGKYEYVHPPPMETQAADLPELSQDMLMEIFALLEIPDLVRAGSVCQSWRSAYTSLRDMGQYKQQTPCLLYTTESSGEKVSCLYSLVEKRAFRLTLPGTPLHKRLPIGSSHGWVVTADELSELHLVNPITGQQIALPPVITIEQVKPIFNDIGVVQGYKIGWYCAEKDYGDPYGEPSPILTPSELRDHLYYKAFVFPDPLTRSFIVVVIHYPFCQLSFARVGDDKWTWLPHNTRYRDCVYHDGLLYALTSHGQIDAFDITASVVTRKVIIKHMKGISESMYIIRAPWGDLLQVWRTVDAAEQQDGDDDTLCYETEDGIVPVMRTKEIKVFKVDMAANKLVQINSLPYHVLFLGHNQSICLRAEEYPQLRANHVYFTDDHVDLLMLIKNGPRDIGVFDLENRRRKKTISPIWSSWPSPVWITPSIAKADGWCVPCGVGTPVMGGRELARREGGLMACSLT